jgi:predicted nucleotide-binding protein
MINSAISQEISEVDIEIAIAILKLNDIVAVEANFVSFVPGKEGYGSPSQQLSRPMPMPPIRKDARAKAYPIVKEIIEHRNAAALPGIAQPQEDYGMPDMAKDWITAADALALIGLSHYQATRTICKRAHAGLVRAKAKRYFRDAQAADNVDVPAEFWWANGATALEQNWSTGDFETWLDHEIHLRAFGVTFLRSDIENAKSQSNVAAATEGNKNMQNSPLRKHIFIGHGRSPAWLELKDFLEDRLRLSVEEFNSVPTAGIPTAVRLSEMLDGAAFAFLVMTAEDTQSGGGVHARLNVIHEAGLFQGRLGFEKAIILLEQGCEGFSNIDGLGQIRFSKDNIRAAFEQVRHVLERERIIGQP